MKQWKGKKNFILGVVICLTLIPTSTQMVWATNYDNITSDSIKEKQNQIY